MPDAGVARLAPVPASSAGCSGATRAPPSSTSCCRCCSWRPFGAILSGNQKTSTCIVPGDRRDERDVDDVHGARLQHRRSCASRACSSGSAARRCRAGSPTSAGSPPTRSPTPRCRSGSSSSPAGCSSASAGRRTGVELVVFVVAGVVCFASLGVAFSHAIPNFESPPAYVNAVFLPWCSCPSACSSTSSSAPASCATSPRRCRSTT